MTTRTGRASRLWAVLVLLLAAVLTLTGTAANATAASGSTNQNRVKASNAAVINSVGVGEHISAGQQWGDARPQQDFAQGRGVHTFYVQATPAPGATTTGPAVLVHNTSCPIGPRMGYEPNPKHDVGVLGGRIGPQPTNPQAALDDSLLFNSGSGRRVGFDSEAGEIVVFAPHRGGVYHGYVSTWDQLPQDARNALVRERLFTAKGRPR